MRYPKSIADEVDRIEQVISTWPADMAASLDDVIKWVLQFDEGDFGLALRVVQNLNVVGQRDIDRGLQIAFSKLVRKAVEKNSRITGQNTMYASMGEVGKSGAMIGYHLRMNASISEENFLGPESFHHIEAGRVENLVLLDDVIGTGHQATKEIEKLAESVLPLGVKNIFVLSVCGMKNAIEEIEEKTKAFTFSAFEYNVADTASSLDSPFYAGVPHDERLLLRNRLKEYGKICYKSNPLGYGELAGLLVLPYNTPNFTLPIVWSDNNEWIPLFRRVRRVNGISAYYKQFKEAVEKKTQADKPADESTDLGNVTLFVEGKRDEVFFDELVTRAALAEQIGAKSVSVVSLGSNVAPERLAELLASTTPNAVFVVDDDRYVSARVHERLQKMAPVIFLKPSYFQFFDIERLANETLPEEAIARLPEMPREQIAIEVERHLVRSGPIDRALRLTRDLVERYIVPSEVNRFVEQLREAVHRPRSHAGPPTAG
jgi:hypothetical protein